MTATVLDGKKLSAEIKTELKEEVQRFQQTYQRAPGLVVVRVEGDAASGVYTKAILRIAKELGVEARLELLPADTTTEGLRDALLRLNSDPAMHGVIVQMPLPEHLSQRLVAETLAAEKDIDGISLQSAGNLALGFPSFHPSTAAAVVEILERTQTPIEGKRVVILGRSNVVGKPLALMLLQRNATVTICHSRTQNLREVMRESDILIVAVGRPTMVKAEMVRPGATVIDVGTNALPEGGIVGDVDYASVSAVAGALTPVPGGVGPLTNVMLMKQCIEAAWRQERERARSR
ncbi:bifunctional 5,10-methylenetetrahydrofolate dehydrogenase/5,10-methenyltetrahydrofolate cyclohydrolase [Ktedonobacter racemifer]|uniref:Bifunctional protein FolD n=1 Tax=Ktedonobacter racemifer DSM 44963 TaxID=485913 RepID=D6U6V7_KTERA|nr:bifunctional 5,10-methylenetetrahydrofolate dehydrogenase/5,10-methenyltetrahydrofolate cyclohydrolase [Ktedonobacter racemifer]EFH80718.1 Methylenetetrahydrofolate dehydrogenase (NADP(+)) [Ktedonobacter racemifer DSM 44963]